MKPIVIFGTGDIAALAHYYFQSDTKRIVEAFTVDRQYLTPEFDGKRVVPFDEIVSIFPPNHYDLFIALSYKKMNSVREEKYILAKQAGYTLASYVSSRCSYLSQFRPGDNCFILEDNTIQPFVSIGNNVTLWSGNHIGHHSTIKDHSFISSQVVVSGHCTVEPNCFVGVNATLFNNIVVAKNNIIGAGAVISHSTKPNQVYLPQKSTLFSKMSNEIDL